MATTRPWEEESGVWAWPEMWVNVSPEFEEIKDWRRAYSTRQPPFEGLTHTETLNLKRKYLDIEMGITGPGPTWEKRYKAEGLGEEYDPTLPTGVPDYPNLSGMMDSFLSLRRTQSRRKGHASTRVTRGNLGDLFLSKTGLFPL